MARLLNISDVQSQCWQRLKTHYAARLIEWRTRLENPTIEERERIALCWQIDAAKKLLAFEDEARKNVTGAGE